MGPQQPGYQQGQQGNERTWWMGVARQLLEVQRASASAIAHNIDDQARLLAFQEALRQAQVSLLEIFQAKGFLGPAQSGAQATRAPFSAQSASSFPAQSTAPFSAPNGIPAAAAPSPAQHGAFAPMMAMSVPAVPEEVLAAAEYPLPDAPPAAPETIPWIEPVEPETQAAEMEQIDQCPYVVADEKDGYLFCVLSKDHDGDHRAGEGCAPSGASWLRIDQEHPCRMSSHRRRALRASRRLMRASSSAD